MMNFTSCIPASDFGLRSKRGVLGFLPRQHIDRWNGCAAADFHYCFDPMLWESMRQWWENDDTVPALLCSGPEGCGKHSFVHEFLLRVNASWVRISCKKKKFAQGELFAADVEIELQDLVRHAVRLGKVVWFDDAECADEAMRDFLIRTTRTKEREYVGRSATLCRHPDSRILITLSTASATTSLAAWCQELLEGNWQHHHDYLVREDEIAMVSQKSKKAAKRLDASTIVALARCAVLFARRTRAAAKHSALWAEGAWGHHSVLALMNLLLQSMADGQRLTEEVLRRSILQVGSRWTWDAQALALLQIAHYEFSSFMQES